RPASSPESTRLPTCKSERWRRRVRAPGTAEAGYTLRSWSTSPPRSSTTSISASEGRGAGKEGARGAADKRGGGGDRALAAPGACAEGRRARRLYPRNVRARFHPRRPDLR